MNTYCKLKEALIRGGELIIKERGIYQILIGHSSEIFKKLKGALIRGEGALITKEKGYLSKHNGLLSKKKGHLSELNRGNYQRGKRPSQRATYGRTL